MAARVPTLPDYLDADSATRFLGVQRATLYAYASRGLVQRAPGPDGRSRLYKRSDLEQLRARHDARTGHGPTAAAALRFGAPVLESAITDIDRSLGPIYRGITAVDFARRHASIEAVADHLWATEHLPERWTQAMRAADVLGPVYRAPLPKTGHIHGRMVALVARAALDDDDRFDAPRDRELARGRRIMHLLVHALPNKATAARTATGRPRLATRIAAALGLRPSEERHRAIDAALVLLADHELNASSFATRVAASTHADLNLCVAAALATVSGPEHGSAPDRVEALCSEIGRPARAITVVRARARRGESIPGFGHALYTDGDPRTPPLLEQARALAPRSAALKVTLALVDAMRDAGHSPPTVDVGLVALTTALGLPPGSASALFALGRSAGWIAHALEQRAQGFILRPRARYVGPARVAVAT